MNVKEEEELKLKLEDKKQSSTLKRGNNIIGTKSNKQLRHIENFTESWRRTSVAYNLISQNLV